MQGGTCWQNLLGNNLEVRTAYQEALAGRGGLAAGKAPSGPLASEELSPRGGAEAQSRVQSSHFQAEGAGLIQRADSGGTWNEESLFTNYSELLRGQIKARTSSKPGM